MTLLPGRVVVLFKPLTALSKALLDGRELEVRIEAHELLVAGSLLVLPVGLGGVKHDFTLEIHAFGHCSSYITDANFIFFAHTQDDGLRGVVGAHDPHCKAG